ncbi:MAG: type IV pilin [Thermoplasmatales archaeon]|nr:type IV pilin [Thermoplasmatales archaeon]
MVKIKNLKIRNNAVSEVFGTLLILVISVSIFTVVYASILSIQIDRATPSVNIIGSIEDNYLVINHLGGKPLDLDTQVILSQGNGNTTRVNVTDYLTNEQKSNNKWDLGEKIKINLNYLDGLDGFERFSSLDLTVVDVVSNSAVLMGNVQEDRYADINISLSVSDTTVTYDQTIDITIDTTNLGPSNVSNVTVKLVLPSGLNYETPIPTGFDNSTGIWDVGDLEGNNDSAQITIYARVSPPQKKLVKLCFLIDGSDAIPLGDFNYILNAIKNAVLTGKIPNKNNTELIIIQYGENTQEDPYPYGELELKELVYPDNIGNIVSKINNINKFGGNLRPLAHAFYYARLWIPTAYSSSAYVDTDNWQKIINLVIGGNPNVLFQPSKFTSDTSSAWSHAKIQRNLLINSYSPYPKSYIELDAEAVNWEDDDLDVVYLTTDIVYPQPGEFCDPGEEPTGPGWVKNIQSSTDFEDTISKFFSTIFSGGKIVAELESSSYRDPNPENDRAEVTIVMKGP